MKVKKLAAMALTGMLMSALFTTPAFANIKDGPANTHTETVQEEDETSESASRIDDDINADDEESDAVVPAGGQNSENEDKPLTPEGNMSLVDDISTDSGKQFITLTTRGGHYYYLIIDRSSNHEQNVYFLNQVDERDLLSVMSDEDRKALEQEQTEKAEAKAAEEAARKAEEEAAKKAAEEALSRNNESGTTGKAEPAVDSNGSQGRFIHLGGIAIPLRAIFITGAFFCAAVFAGAAFIFKRRKDMANAEPDPDADYEDAYDDEYILEEEGDEEESYDKDSEN